MKKELFLALAVCAGLMAASLNGCGNKNESAPKVQEGMEVTEETTELKEQLYDAELQVFIAASLSGAMEEIAGLYKEVQPNVAIVYNADSSGTLQTQIEEGFACDIFFSAAEKQMDALAEGGYVKDGSKVNLLENSVVLISPKGSGTKVTGFEDVTKAANFALASESVPAGNYSRQIFKKLGILEDVMTMEINECKNVSAVKEAVKEGANEIGTVYYSDAYSVREDVDILAYSDETMLDTAIIYPAALIHNLEADEEQIKAAEDFMEFLQTDAAKDVFQNYMFLIHE